MQSRRTPSARSSLGFSRSIRLVSPCAPLKIEISSSSPPIIRSIFVKPEDAMWPAVNAPGCRSCRCIFARAPRQNRSSAVDVNGPRSTLADSSGQTHRTGAAVLAQERPAPDFVSAAAAAQGVRIRRRSPDSVRTRWKFDDADSRCRRSPVDDATPRGPSSHQM